MFPPRAKRGYVVYHSSVPPSHRQVRSLLVSVWPQCSQTRRGMITAVAGWLHFGKVCTCDTILESCVGLETTKAFCNSVYFVGLN